MAAPVWTSTFTHAACMFDKHDGTQRSDERAGCACGREKLAHRLSLRPGLRFPPGISELCALFAAVRNLRVSFALGAPQPQRLRAISDVQALLRTAGKGGADADAALEAALAAADLAARAPRIPALPAGRTPARTAADLSAAEGVLVAADEAYHRTFYAAELLAAPLLHPLPPPHVYFAAPGLAVDVDAAEAAARVLLSELSPSAEEWALEGLWPLPSPAPCTPPAAEAFEGGPPPQLGGRKRPREAAAAAVDGAGPAGAEANPLLALGRARWAEGVLRLVALPRAAAAGSAAPPLPIGAASSLGGLRARPLRPGERVTRSGTDPLASLPVHAWRASARVWACHLYAYATPTRAALDALAALGPLVEVGAGTGYWAAALRSRGVEVHAYDVAPLRERGAAAAPEGVPGGKAPGGGGSGGKKKGGRPDAAAAAAAANEYHGSALAWTSGASPRSALRRERRCERDH